MVVELSEKQIKNGWQIVKFEEIAQQCKEKVDRDNNPFERYVEGGHMDSENLRITRWGTFGNDYVGPAFHRVFRKGQILYGSRRTYLKKVALADFNGITANTTFVIEPQNPELVLPGLLPFIMLSDDFTNHSVLNSKGSTNPYINWGDIAKYEFPMPPIHRQKEILSLLEKIETCNQNIFNCEQTIEALYKQLLLKMFPNFFEKHSKSHQSLPNGWKQIELGRLLVSVPESGYSANEISENSEWHVLNLNCLSKSGFVNNGYKSIAQKDFIAGKEILDGDFLISRSNTKDLVGAVGIYSKNDKRAIFPDTMWRLNLRKDLILSEYLEGYLLSPYGRRQLIRIAAGTSGSMVKINKQSLKKLPVPTPSLDIQKQIISATKSLKSCWRTLLNRKNQFLTLRQSIFNGEI
nr:restriction endonuclease subunit S [uncultured Desulfobacter sp.]